MGEKTCGTIINMCDICVSDIFSRIGYDFLWVDFEHSYLSYEDILMHTTVAQGNGTPVVVRVPQNDFTATKKVLDMGVDGIIFPMVKTEKEVRDLINFSLYPPIGNRGFGPMAAINYGLSDAREYVRSSNEDICRFIQIECAEMIDDLDMIMKNEYIDGYIFGPNDLSGSINDFLNVYDQKTTELMERTVKKLKDHNKYVGIATGSNKKDVIEHWFNMGADMVCSGGDFVFLADGATSMFNILKKHMGGKNNG
jgi:2-dehydro-3-deoxyglucarate aldolase/4-hydroxy-2-oxoheptanedioate aldolase